MNTAGIESSKEFESQYYHQVSEPALAQGSQIVASSFPEAVVKKEAKKICSRICTVAAGEIESKEKYRQVVSSLAHLQSFNTIDDYSAENMALALEYINVDTLESALSMDLRIIPPGPVFYTWAAIHKTSIFDTLYNPEQYADLNYVAKIKENANRLAKKEIPVIVIFSECEMPCDQVFRMEISFADNQNIVVLSVESDLKDCLESSPEVFEYKSAWFFLDALRIAIIRDFKMVLSAALKSAGKEKKEIAKIGLMKEVGSISYTDTDNEFLEQSPDYVISCNGLYSFSKFYRNFSLHLIKEESLNRLPPDEAQRVRNHQNYFIGHPYIDDKNHRALWDSEKIANSFSYIYSGKARSEFIELLRIVSKVEDVSFIQPDMDIWDSDNGLISVKVDAMNIFKERTSLRNMSVNFFEKPEKNKTGNLDPFYSIAHSLVGIQLWRTFLGGRDGSWQRVSVT